MKTSGGVSELWHRISRDLRVDYRKTLVMLVLAAVLIVVVLVVLTGDDEALPNTGGGGSAALGSQDPASPGNGMQGENGSAHSVPHHLAEALPLNELGRNPFKPFFTATMQDRGAAPPPPDQIEAGDLAQSEEKRLESIHVTCTVTGPGQAYAIVDGKILKVNDVHKGFVVVDIGDRSVLFQGKTLSLRIPIKY